MVRRGLTTLALLSLSLVCGAAQPPDDLTGTWVWSIEGRNALVLDLKRGPRGLDGTMQMPGAFTFGSAGSGLAVSGVKGPIRTVPVFQVREITNGVVLRFAPAGGHEEQISLVRGATPGSAEFRFSPDGPSPVAYLIHPRDPNAVATDWDPSVSYLARAPEPPGNSEMAEIFAVDQADRKDGPNTDWKVVSPRDEAHRRRVRQMLDQGLLRSGSDLYYAAFVFQHGDSPDDYLLAHILAMAAQARGRPDAGWISTATLDRYLNSIGRPQAFGTQFEPDGKAQKSMDRELVPPSIRPALGLDFLAPP